MIYEFAEIVRERFDEAIASALPEYFGPVDNDKYLPRVRRFGRPTPPDAKAGVSVESLTGHSEENYRNTKPTWLVMTFLKSQPTNVSFYSVAELLIEHVKAPAAA